MPPYDRRWTKKSPKNQTHTKTITWGWTNVVGFIPWHGRGPWRWSVREHQNQNNAYIYIIQSLIAPPPCLPIVLELMQILFRKLNITFLQIKSRKAPALSPGHLPKFKPLHINNSDDHGLPSLPSNIDTYNPLSYLVYSLQIWLWISL